MSYDKGAAFVHILRFMMDDDTLFYNSLQNFQATFKDSVAIGLDVRDQLNAMSNVNFDDAFNEWYYGEGYPTYSVKYNVVNDDLLFEVSHTTSSSTPTFTNPLELEIKRTNLPDTTIRVDISSNSSHFSIPNFGSSLQTIIVDPNNWIINKVGSVAKDENYLSIPQENKSVAVNIYPNPSLGEFNIVIDDNIEKAIKINNTQGELVYEGSFNNSQKVNLLNQEAGYYIVRITSKDGRQWVKTIVKK